MIPVTQLLTPITTAQMRSTLVNLLVTLGVRADLWRAGGVASTILTVMATTASGFSTLMCAALSSNFLDYATGSWLVLLAYYVYGVTATPATYATGQLTLTNSGGGVYSYAVGLATFLNTTTAQTYTNSTVISLGAMATQTISVICTTAGTIGNAPPGEVTALVTTMLGVTCTNASAIAGQDAQSDASLRTACQAALAAQSVRGPRGAYQYAVSTAINPITNALVNINRIQVTSATSTGIVSVYCASPSGAPSADDLTGAATSIEAVARPNAVTANVYAVSTTSDSDAIVVWAQALPGVSAAAVQVAAANAVAAYIALYPIGGLVTFSGGMLFASVIDGVIYATNPAIYAVTGTTSHAIAAGQVITDNTTITVNVVAA